MYLCVWKHKADERTESDGVMLNSDKVVQKGCSLRVTFEVICDGVAVRRDGHSGIRNNMPKTSEVEL
jgi:hypothetical protein